MNIFKQYFHLEHDVYIFFLGKITTNLGSMIRPLLIFILSIKMGLNSANVSLLTVFSGIIIIPSIIIGGKLADSFNKKNCIVYCDIISILFYLSCSFIPLSYITIFFLVIASSFQCMEEPIYNSIYIDLAKKNNKDVVFSLMYLATNIGIILSPLIGGFLFANHLRLCFFINAIAISCSTIIIKFFSIGIYNVEKCNMSEQSTSSPAETFTVVLFDSKVLLLFLFLYSLFYAILGLYNFIFPFELGTLFKSQGAIIYGSMSSINGLLIISLTPFITSFFKIFKPLSKLLLGQLCLFLGYFIFFIKANYIFFCYISIFFISLSQIFTSLTCGPYLTNRIKSTYSGRILAFSNFLHNLFYGLLTLLYGHINNYFNNFYSWLFIFILITITFSLNIFNIILDKRRYNDLT